MGRGGVGQPVGQVLINGQLFQTDALGNILNNQVVGSQVIGSQVVGNQVVGSQVVGNQVVGSQVVGSQTVGQPNFTIPLIDRAGNEVQVASDVNGNLIDSAGNSINVPRINGFPVDSAGNILRVALDSNNQPILISTDRAGNFIGFPTNNGFAIRPVLANNAAVNNNQGTGTGTGIGTGTTGTGTGTGTTTGVSAADDLLNVSQELVPNDLGNLRKFTQNGKDIIVGKDTDGKFKRLFINKFTGALSGTGETETLRQLRDYYSARLNIFTDPGEFQLVSKFLASPQVASLFQQPANQSPTATNGATGSHGIGAGVIGGTARATASGPATNATKFIKWRNLFAAGTKPTTQEILEAIDKKNRESLSSSGLVAKQMTCVEKSAQDAGKPFHLFLYRDGNELKYAFSMNDIQPADLAKEADDAKSRWHKLEDDPGHSALANVYTNAAGDAGWDFQIKKIKDAKDPLDAVVWLKKFDPANPAAGAKEVFYCK